MPPIDGSTREQWDFKGSVKRAAAAMGNARFSQFIEDFERYTYEVTMNMTAAPASEILNMQGRSQQCQTILRALKDELKASET
jgi:hypothetical protein